MKPKLIVKTRDEIPTVVPEKPTIRPHVDVRYFVNMEAMQMDPAELDEFDKTIERLEKEAEYGLEHAPHKRNDRWKASDVVQTVDEEGDHAENESP